MTLHDDGLAAARLAVVYAELERARAECKLRADAAEARAEKAERELADERARRERVEAVLWEIAEHDPIDAALDPQWASRLASAALSGSTAALDAVRAEARRKALEEAAKVCDERAAEADRRLNSRVWPAHEYAEIDAANTEASDCAAAIRALPGAGGEG